MSDSPNEDPSLGREQYVKAIKDIDPVTRTNLLKGDWNEAPPSPVDGNLAVGFRIPASLLNIEQTEANAIAIGEALMSSALPAIMKAAAVIRGEEDGGVTISPSIIQAFVPPDDGQNVRELKITTVIAGVEPTADNFVRFANRIMDAISAESLIDGAIPGVRVGIEEAQAPPVADRSGEA